ncbi:DUF721 domain-containing protein [Thermosipho ferrireducens]|uniref:DUF721 domain-containing protein n=1 Tax=Thermosipho ferrireducens TaxID=2571116 RepID=A0ABX7S8V4_9BACT|nr:DUF721 domain-containing protein [Thermosipho ferrireducens]QTA38286.1 DUF721 domain-containing protein [Thermosipho ferrireducens]
MQRFSEVLKELSKRNNFFRTVYIGTVAKSELSRIIGIPFSEHCFSTKFSKGVLYIHCDDQIYVTEMVFFREKIKEELNKKIGFKAIEKIVVRRGYKGGF